MFKFNYLRHFPHVLSVIMHAYVNWPYVIISLIFTRRATGLARDGSSWEGDVYQIYDYARMYLYTGCSIRSATQESIELSCRGQRNDVRLRIMEWRGADLITMIADYGALLGPSIKGKSVLDVGAFVGDSAVLFAAMGAKRVVAVEPSPWAYQVAERNIEINGLSNVVTLVKCAVTKEDGKVLMVPSGKTTGGFRISSSTTGDVPIPTCTLDSLIEKYGPFDVVKMDCEGCEHESIPYSRRIGEVKEVLMEYHGGYEDIVKKLREEGFRVAFSRSVAVPKVCGKPLDPKLGYIYATKDLTGDKPTSR